MSAHVIPMPLRNAPRRRQRKPAPLLKRLRRQANLLLRYRAWSPATAELRELLLLAKHSGLRRDGRPCSVWFDGVWFKVRETVLTRSVLDPETHEPIAGVWHL
ncbi:hypothetical protein MASR1M60_30730 [Rhodocyclaceae bacterium]